MRRAELASQLRRRLLRRLVDGPAERRRWRGLDAQAVIDSFITCPDCGQRRFDDQELGRLIHHCTSAAEFLYHLETPPDALLEALPTHPDRVGWIH